MGCNGHAYVITLAAYALQKFVARTRYRRAVRLDGVSLAPRAGMAAKRIDPDTARENLATSNALLVCAYDDRARCRSLQIEGAIDLVELEAQEEMLPRDRELIFYCA